MRIKLFIIGLFFGLLNSSFTYIKLDIKNIENQQVNFVDRWLGDSESDRYYFLLIITHQADNKIEGYHNIVALNGHKIDSTDPDWGDTPSITGIIKGNTATITFESVFTPNKTGIATLKFIAPDKIKWKTVKEIDGENYFPDEAILVRESSLPMSALKEEELAPKPKPSSELEEESEPLLHWGLKLSDRDRGYFDGGVAYQQCKEEQDKEDRDIFDRYRRMPIEGMEWESKAPKLGLGDCREEAFERIKMSTKEYKDGFEKGWRDASMPLNKEKETTKKK